MAAAASVDGWHKGVSGKAGYLDEDPSDDREAPPDRRLQVDDSRFHFLAGEPITQLDAEIQQHVVGSEMRRQHLDHAFDAAIRDGDLDNSVDDRRIGALAEQQSLAFQGKEDSKAIEQAWPNLSNGDRFIRYAARLAIESQPVAEWNPMSALAAASRELFGNPNPAAAVDAWPMQHPELAVIGWSVLMLLVFAPLAVRQFRRKVLG